MRWAVQRQEPERAAKVGDKRTVMRFAWWPTLVDLDDEVPCKVWWEEYYAMQTYQCIEVGGDYGSWYKYRWVTTAKFSSDPLVDEALRQLAEDAT